MKKYIKPTAKVIVINSQMPLAISPGGVTPPGVSPTRLRDSLWEEDDEYVTEEEWIDDEE